MGAMFACVCVRVSTCVPLYMEMLQFNYVPKGMTRQAWTKCRLKAFYSRVQSREPAQRETQTHSRNQLA